MEESVPCFSPIDKLSKTIRLLKLHQTPNPLDNRIQCTLSTALLDHPPSYEALSYTWGEPNELEDDFIWVNSSLLPVRSNLLSALNAIRSHGVANRVLWIDALCINQESEQERNHQVGLMEFIYRKASRVLVWLGAPKKMPPSLLEEKMKYYGIPKHRLDRKGDVWMEKMLKETHDAWEAIRMSPSPPPVMSALEAQRRTRLEEIMQIEEGLEGCRAFELLHLAANDPSTFQPGFVEGRYPSRWEQKFVYDASLRPHWQQLSELCNAAYWTRLWIIQEIGLASHLLLLYGNEVCDWDNFRIVRQTIARTKDRQALGDDSSLHQFCNSFAAQFDTQREDMHDGLTLESLLELCGTSGTAYCAERRDKVYGLLGLAKDVEMGDIPIDYSRSLEDIYLDCIWLKTGDENIVRFSHYLMLALISPLSPELEHFQLKVDTPRYPFLATDKKALHEDEIPVLGYKAGVICTVNFSQVFSNITKQTPHFDFSAIMDAVIPRKGNILFESQWTLGLLDLFNFEHTSLADSRGRIQFFGAIGTDLEDYVGIASTKIQDGDILLRFPRCPVAAVIRAHGESWEIISPVILACVKSAERIAQEQAGVSFLDEKGDVLVMPVVPPRYQPDKTVGSGSKSADIVLNISIPILQDLTCPRQKRPRERRGVQSPPVDDTALNKTLSNEPIVADWGKRDRKLDRKIRHGADASRRKD